MIRLRHLLHLAPLFALASCASLAPPAPASVIERFEIISRTPAFGGAPFDGGGEYETIVAVAHMRIDPAHPANRQIADIGLAAPKGAWVPYKTDVVIMRPRAPANASRTLIVELPNRGNALFPVMVNDADTEPRKMPGAGNGFTMRRGHTMVWIGWQGDVPLAADGSAVGMQVPVATLAGAPITGPSFAEAVFDRNEAGGAMTLAYPAASLDQSQATLTVRSYAGAVPTPVARANWHFDGPSAIGFTRPDGVDAGAIYRFEYQASQPRLMGLGMAALRDVTAYLKSGEGPLADIKPDLAIAVGVSQSGRALRDMIWQGFNQDPRGGKVFDGAMPLIAGSRKSYVNLRFAQPGRYSTQHLDHVTYGDQFPFSYAVTRDPVSGKTDGIFRRCQASATCPKLMHIDSSIEFWQGRASLVVDNGAGKDIALPPEVRTYLLSSTQHMAAERPSTGICKNASNPARQAPAVRALLDGLVDWTRSGKEPPPSRYPLHADSMLVAPTRDSVGFPDIAGVEFPVAVNELTVVDYSGARPRPEPAKRYQLFVPMADVDGNDIAGIRLPDVAAPLATYTGWNLRKKGYAEWQLCGLNGSYLPFPATARAGDTRRALAQRYPNRMAYAKAVALAARELRDQGLLLQEDVDRYIERARAESRIGQ